MNSRATRWDVPFGTFCLKRDSGQWKIGGLEGNDNAVGMTDLVAMDFNPWKKSQISQT